MKINGYTLTYEPDGFEDTNTPLYSELQVPFGDHVLMDMGGTTSQYSFNIILKDNEIKDIVGMIDGYKLVYIEYGDLEGFFYVTQFDRNWVKNMTNYKLVSFKVTGYMGSGDSYLKLGHFSDNQKTDYTLTQTEIVSLPAYYVSKVSEAYDYQITTTTNTGKYINYYIAPDMDITFKASNDILSNGCIKVYKNGNRIYGNTNVDGEIIIDTNLYKYTVLDNNASYVMSVKDYTGTVVGYISDTLNSVKGADTYISINPFRTVLKVNHTKYIFKVNKPYVEITKSPNYISPTLSNRAYALKPNTTIGTRHLTTIGVATLCRDTTIGAGTPPSGLNHVLSPGFIKHTGTDTITRTTFTTQMNINGPNGFTENTERNFLLHSTVVPQYIVSTDWTKINFSDRTDGATYNGLTNYVSSSTADATITAPLNIPFTGYYDIYLMASNYDTCPAGTYEFYINTVLKGTTSQLSWTTSDTKANFVYLGNHVFYASANPQSFQIKLKTGKIGVFYLVAIPTNNYYLNVNRTPYEYVCSAFMDTNESFEVY